MRKAVLLAALPPTVPKADDLNVKAELHCAHFRAVIDSALPVAPDVDVQAASKGSVVVIGGSVTALSQRPGCAIRRAATACSPRWSTVATD